MRTVLQRERGGRGRLDFHSGNNHKPGDRGRYGGVSPALQYMSAMPHLDSLWFGEGFEWTESADYFTAKERDGRALEAIGCPVHMRPGDVLLFFPGIFHRTQDARHYRVALIAEAT